MAGSKWANIRFKDSAPVATVGAAVVRVLGIDPGSQATGFGVLDVQGSAATAVRWGTIRTAGEHHVRLRAIFIGVAELVAELKPDEIAIERVFMNRNADSALKLGQARAAALCATFAGDIPVFEYAARHIKKAVAGTGSAEKDQVQQMVKMILSIREDLEADAADALAAAICHAHERTTRLLVERVAGAR
ncbi:MAG TPA: crossover junction endodeoxyribonuclease RuvC [Gammaproteobacteria bacterium]|jgi:crossover junction endodeoxyribonuclease RuvC